MDMDFKQGILLTNGERHDTMDSAFSHFDNLAFITPSNTTYQAFDDLRCWTVSDPSFKFNELHQDEHTVERTNGITCS